MTKLITILAPAIIILLMVAVSEKQTDSSIDTARVQCLESGLTTQECRI